MGIENDEVQTPEPQDAAAEAAAFDAGFGGTEFPAESTPADATAPAAPTDAVPPADQPKVVQLTEDDYRKLLDSSAQVAEIKSTIEKQFGTAFGKIGGIERLMDQLKSNPATPAGVKKIELTDEMIGEIAAEYPELSKSLRASLGKLVDAINDTISIPAQAAPAEPAPASAAPAQPSVDTNVLKLQIRREMTEETLDDFQADWRKVIGLPNEQGVVPDTEFRKWLATQPAAYADKVKSTYRADVLTDALTKFKAHQDKANGRRQVLAAGAVPRGSGAQAPTAAELSAEDEFNAGFKGG